MEFLGTNSIKSFECKKGAKYGFVLFDALFLKKKKLQYFSVLRSVCSALFCFSLLLLFSYCFAKQSAVLVESVHLAPSSFARLRRQSGLFVKGG